MTRSTPLPVRTQTLVYADLPLAVYREIAAHLEQVNGVQTTLRPREFDRFDYHQSQIGSLLVDYTPEFNERDLERVMAILDYYARRHGSYQLS